VREKVLHLTVVNANAMQPEEAQILLKGASAASATARVITNSDIHAHNTFEHRDAVAPQSREVSIAGGQPAFTFPPASVTALSIRLT
jgi:alpha-L-arabinofuranosidase